MGHRLRRRKYSHVAAFLLAGANFGHGDGFKDGLQRLEKVEVFIAGGVFVCTNHISFVPPPPELARPCPPPAG